MATTADIEIDVLIVGAGIAGSALACALRDSDLSMLILEKSDAPLDTARGDHLQPHTVATLERWGVLDEFLANGAEKRRGSVWYSADGEKLLDSSVAELDLPHPYFLFLDHEKIGETLLQRALEARNVSIERPIRNWWRENDDTERIVIRVGKADGGEMIVAARILVGADGRSSRVRKVFGFAAELHRYRRPIVVLFGRRPARDPANRLEVYLNDTQMVAVIPRTGGGSKIGVPVDPEDLPEWRNASQGALRRKLEALAPQLDVSEIRYADVYPPIYLRAEDWVSDNVVLIGDACHAMHPARSQGMNVAIRCVDQLANTLKQCAVPLRYDDVRRSLSDYESALRPLIDAMLEKNHEAGLAMDRSGADDYRRTCESLKGVESNPKLNAAFAMNAAGYPIPPS